METEAPMTKHLTIEQDRGYGWQVRAEGPIPADTGMDAIRNNAMRCALNGPVRALLDGVEVFACKKLTNKQAKALWGI